MGSLDGFGQVGRVRAGIELRSLTGKIQVQIVRHLSTSGNLLPPGNIWIVDCGLWMVFRLHWRPLAEEDSDESEALGIVWLQHQLTPPVFYEQGCGKIT